MPATTDTLAPGYAWVPPRLAAARAADAQDAIDARHVAASSALYDLCIWLAETWDVVAADSTEEEAARCETVLAAVEAALLPWRAEALAHVREQRRKDKFPTHVRLFGERV